MLKMTIRLLAQVFLGMIFIIGLLFTTTLFQIYIDPATTAKINDVATATPDEIRLFATKILLGSLILSTIVRIAIYIILEMSVPQQTNKTTKIE